MTDLVKLRIDAAIRGKRNIGFFAADDRTAMQSEWVAVLCQIVCDATHIAISLLAQKPEEGKHEPR